MKTLALIALVTLALPFSANALTCKAGQKMTYIDHAEGGKGLTCVDAAVSQESLNIARQAAKALLDISMSVSGSDRLLIESSKVISSDDTSTMEEVVVNAFKSNEVDEQTTSTLTYTIQILDGMVWSVKTKCATCG